MSDQRKRTPYKSAEKLAEQIKKTWSPPLTAGNETQADIAQTCSMQAIAFCFGIEILGELTEAQERVVNEGLKVMRSAIG